MSHTMVRVSIHYSEHPEIVTIINCDRKLEETMVDGGGVPGEYLWTKRNHNVGGLI